MMGMKIVTDNYNNPSFVHIIVRELCKVIYTIPFIGIILVLVSNYVMG